MRYLSVCSGIEAASVAWESLGFVPVAFSEVAPFPAGQGRPTIAGTTGVRRLTPRECERLQGFPDDWTLVPHRGKPAADGPRYKAIGNSLAVPVMRWIGKRMFALERPETA